MWRDCRRWGITRSRKRAEGCRGVGFIVDHYWGRARSSSSQPTKSKVRQDGWCLMGTSHNFPKPRVWQYSDYQRQRITGEPRFLLSHLSTDIALREKKRKLNLTATLLKDAKSSIGSNELTYFCQAVFWTNDRLSMKTISSDINVWNNWFRGITEQHNRIKRINNA